MDLLWVSQTLIEKIFPLLTEEMRNQFLRTQRACDVGNRIPIYL